MARKSGDSQQKLKIITSIDDTPGQQHQDPNGQVSFLGISKALVPPGFEPFADLMNNKLAKTQRALEDSTKALTSTAKQNERLANSLESVIPKILDQSINDEKPDLVLAQLKEGQEADVAIADGMTVPSEAVYTLSAGDIAQKVGNDKMNASQMGTTLRKLKIFGDTKFHHERMHGKTPFQCYKPTVIDEIYRRVAKPTAYELNPVEVGKIANKLKPKEAISQ